MKAIYFEYDLDNGWDSHFFLCQDYRRADENDEDWACEWLSAFNGPGNPTLARLYKENKSFDETPFALGSTLYLVARTVATFGSAFGTMKQPPPCSVCMAFHDQNPIIRRYSAA